MASLMYLLDIGVLPNREQGDADCLMPVHAAALNSMQEVELLHLRELADHGSPGQQRDFGKRLDRNAGYAVRVGIVGDLKG
jgi:hypothetical protein